jgi:uridine phosphorylase
MKDAVTDANFPRDAEGRTLHVGTKPGEVANRIIIVGDYTRAHRIAKCFDGGKAILEFESHRKFLTLTGTFQGVPITVVAIGMGFSVSQRGTVLMHAEGKATKTEYTYVFFVLS